MYRYLSGFITFAAIGLVAAAQPATPAHYPQDADAGQCFARVMAPPQTETVTEEVLVTPETYRIEVIPAVFETVTERILVREEGVRHRVIPAVYETIEEEILVEPERVERTVIPARFETYTETVIIEPERVVWKPGKGLYGRSSPQQDDPVADQDQATGEVLCRVTVPARTETVTRSRMIAPARVEETVIPARYETITKTVMVEPARVEDEIIPAVYEERQVTRMVRPAEERRVTVPAVYETVTREVETGMGGLEWAEVLCATNTDRYKVAEIQGALTDAGYPTRIDGIFGPLTSRAMIAFQRANGLAAGYMTVDTARALDIDPYGAPPDTVYAALGGRPPPEDRA